MSSKNWAKASGFYRDRKIGARGAINRRCLHTEEWHGVESYLHVTKGWRNRRTYDVADNEAGRLLLSFRTSP